MAFSDAEFGSWRIDLDEEAGEAVACWLDNVGAFRDGDGIFAVRSLPPRNPLLDDNLCSAVR
jgi:hypothetical protein